MLKSKPFIRAFSAAFSLLLVLSGLVLISTSVSAQELGSGQIEEAESLLHNIVLNGNLAAENGQTKRFTVSVDLLNSSGKVRGNCTGVLIQKDIVMTAGHCFKSSITKVKVNFGLGGARGFTHAIYSTKFISGFTLPEAKPQEKKSTSGAKPVVQEKLEDALNYDAQAREKYLGLLAVRKGLVNYSPSKTMSVKSFGDFALIHISQIPEGYGPVRIYEGQTSYRMPLIAAGYGMNTRVFAKNDWALRWSRFELIGHYTLPNELTAGWQIHSPTDQQACYGDSGGPLFVETSRGLQLLGTNLFTKNNCAGANWYSNIRYNLKQIQKDIATLRALRDV